MHDSPQSPSLNRRSFLHTLGSGTLGLGVASALSSSLSATGTGFTSTTKSDAAAAVAHSGDTPRLQVGEGIAVTDTAYGMVRGFILDDIHIFRGIPYGADTSGANRFMPPKPPTPWNGVRSALWWGPSAPQQMEGRYANQHYAFADHWNYDEISEDCLRLNIWTPDLESTRPRPVLVWLHGGGFVNGNAIEQDGYDGENLARSGNVVFCSVNHRLGPLGFANLAGTGAPEFTASGNVGMLDIVAALGWVRDNIRQFGGDPENVTIIGQSGGGAKVCTLAAMPSAKGLFHKAVALSGTSLSGLDKLYSEKLGQYVLAEAGLTPDHVTKLQQIPWPEYLALAHRAAKKLADESGDSPGFRGGFRPVSDGEIVQSDRFFSDPNGLSAEVPLMIVSTFNEQSPSREDPALEEVTLEQVKERLRSRFNEKTDEVVDAYAQAFPNAKPVEIWSLVVSNRQQVVAAADAKAKQPAPVYVAWFGWQPPLFDGRLRAFHCIDICFWFNNTDRMLTHTGGGARPRRLAERMSGALLRFMRTGNPNGAGLPDWPAYTPALGETMILDDESAVKNDPDRAARKTLPPI